MRVDRIIALEIGLLVIEAGIAVVWVMHPNSNCEPYLVLIGAVLALLEIHRRTKRSRRPNREKEGFGRLSPITVKEIVDAINAAPPYQKQELERKYNGIRVNWTGYLKEAKEDFLDKRRIKVNLNLNRDAIVGYSFWFTESIASFPEIRTLKSKSRINVVGEIIGASGAGLCVDLKPINVTILEQQATQ